MKGQRGDSLVEVLVSLALLGILGVGILSALGTGTGALLLADQRQTAKNLAESQMEHVKNELFSSSYTAAPIPAEHSGYDAEIHVHSIPGRDINIQKIVVEVRHHGREVLTLEGYKHR